MLETPCSLDVLKWDILSSRSPPTIFSIQTRGLLWPLRLSRENCSLVEYLGGDPKCGAEELTVGIEDGTGK